MEITKGENANLAGMEPRCPECDVPDAMTFHGNCTVSCRACKKIFQPHLLADFAQFFRSPAPTPPLDVEARELEESWSMLVERGVRIYTLSTALIDRDAYARTERAITQLLSLLRRHIASPAPQPIEVGEVEPTEQQIDALAKALGIRHWDQGNDGFGGEWEISDKNRAAIKAFWDTAIKTRLQPAASPAQPEKRDE